MINEDIKASAELLFGVSRPKPAAAKALVRARKANAYRFGDDGLTPNHPR